MQEKHLTKSNNIHDKNSQQIKNRRELPQVKESIRRKKKKEN
jgi:hypothetical protein